MPELWICCVYCLCLVHRPSHGLHLIFFIAGSPSTPHLTLTRTHTCPPWRFMRAPLQMSLHHHLLHCHSIPRSAVASLEGSWRASRLSSHTPLADPHRLSLVLSSMSASSTTSRHPANTITTHARPPEEPLACKAILTLRFHRDLVFL